MLRGSWDKVSRVEGIKIIYQSQPLEAYKYTCTMGHSFCGKTEVLQIFKRDLFNTQPPGKWPHGPIHSACGTEGAPGHWGDTPTTMTIMLKLAKNMLMNRCLMRMVENDAAPLDFLRDALVLSIWLHTIVIHLGADDGINSSACTYALYLTFCPLRFSCIQIAGDGLCLLC